MSYESCMPIPHDSAVLPRRVHFHGDEDGVSDEVVKGSTLTTGSNQIVLLVMDSDYCLDASLHLLSNLQLPGLASHLTEQERMVHLHSLIDVDAINMVRAVGGLIMFLERSKIGMELEDGIPVLSLKTIPLDNLVGLDDNTFGALQIFQHESHPSVYKASQAYSTKEGLSLFVLKDRHDSLDYFANPKNLEITSALQDCLKSVKALPRILLRMRQAQVSIGDWRALHKTACNAVEVRNLCSTRTKVISIFEKISHAFTDDLHRIAMLISRIVDFEESAAQNRFVVKPGVDPDLDAKKNTYNRLPELLTEAAAEELEKLDDSITQCNIVYLPQIGYLLAIPVEGDLKEERDFTLPGVEFMFLSNGVAHYKSSKTKELDSLYGDTQCDINDCETLIMHRLQNTILDLSQVLLEVMNYCAQLDCLISLSVHAKENNYVRPEMVVDSTIVIHEGRHPLQEVCVTSFVPNDTKNGGQCSKMKILTGPNASGKSIYMKQVALIVYLAHIGSFVPADYAQIGITDRILTRVRTMESVSTSLSTFMIDLNQVSIAVNNATFRSLVILDEFGKGTDMVDGVSLLAAVLQHWLALGSSCPNVFVSSHFRLLAHKGLLPETEMLSFQTMECIEEAGEIVFLYKLIDGVAKSSEACSAAAAAGLPLEIIQRAVEVGLALREKKAIQRIDAPSREHGFQLCQTMVDRFLELDLEKDDVKEFLNDYVLGIADHAKM